MDRAASIVGVALECPACGAESVVDVEFCYGDFGQKRYTVGHPVFSGGETEGQVVVGSNTYKYVLVIGSCVLGCACAEGRTPVTIVLVSGRIADVRLGVPSASAKNARYIVFESLDT